LFLKIVLDKANAGLADFLVVEVDQVICASAKSTAALCLLDNDFFTFGVDLQVVVALDLQLPTQFFRQDKRPRLSTRRIMPESFIYTIFLSACLLLPEVNRFLCLFLKRNTQFLPDPCGQTCRFYR